MIRQPPPLPSSFPNTELDVLNSYGNILSPQVVTDVFARKYTDTLYSNQNAKRKSSVRASMQA